MITKETEKLKFLRCPLCKGELKIEKDTLLCYPCKASYPVTRGIPDMLPSLMEEEIKKMADIWGNISYDYDDYLENSNKERLQAIDQPLLDQCKEGGLVLEVGCGTARLKKEVEKKGGRYVGIDPSWKLLEQGLGKGEVDLVRGVGEYLPFPDDHFHVIIGGYHSFRYIELEIAYNEFERVLKPGGILAFSLWNYWQLKVMNVVSNMGNRNNPVKRSHNKDIVCNDVSWPYKEVDKLQKAGFKIKSILSTRNLPLAHKIPLVNRFFGWQGYWKGKGGALMGHDVIFICEKIGKNNEN